MPNALSHLPAMTCAQVTGRHQVTHAELLGKPRRWLCCLAMRRLQRSSTQCSRLTELYLERQAHTRPCLRRRLRSRRARPQLPAAFPGCSARAVPPQNGVQEGGRPLPLGRGSRSGKMSRGGQETREACSVRSRGSGVFAASHVSSGRIALPPTRVSC